MATTETFVPGRLYEMPLADLQPDPNQPRKYLDPVALDELTESVKQQRSFPDPLPDGERHRLRRRRRTAITEPGTEETPRNQLA